MEVYMEYRIKLSLKRCNMKKTSLYFCAFIIITSFTSLFALDYYPVAKDYSWMYKGYWKDNPQKELKVDASIVDMLEDSGKKYYYYSAPSVDVRYFVRTDENWGYMKLIKFPFPVLKFLTVDVRLNPEIKFVKFPYVVGDTWKQEVEAEADMPPFKLKKQIKVEFTVVDTEKFDFKGKSYDIFRVRMKRDEGDNSIRMEDNWFAPYLGFVRGQTTEYYIELKKTNLPGEEPTPQATADAKK
jgi:hypothetical protein